MPRALLGVVVDMAEARAWLSMAVEALAFVAALSMLVVMAMRDAAVAVATPALGRGASKATGALRVRTRISLATLAKARPSSLVTDLAVP